jgi:Conjugal transfer protein TraD
LAGALSELKDALSKTGDERLPRWRAAGAAFRRKDKDRKAAAPRANAGVAEPDSERRLDTRHKIQLGGLVIKAALAGEEPAVLLGIITAAKWVLSVK